MDDKRSTHFSHIGGVSEQLSTLNHVQHGDNMMGLYVARDARVERFQCRCAHAKFLTRAVVFTLCVSLVTVCLSLYVVFTNNGLDSQQCTLSDDDRMLLKELQALKTEIMHGNVRYDLRGDFRDLQGDIVDPSRRVKRAADKKSKRKGKKKQVIRATHLVPRFWDVLKKEDFKNDMTLCLFVKKWDGLGCRNKTFRMKKGPMRFFQEAAWMEKYPHIESPVTPAQDGRFRVVHPGLYSIYSSVLFHDSKKKYGQALMKNDERLFKCMDGVDYLTNNTVTNTKYKTCSLNGIAYLETGDEIWVHNLYENTEVELSDDATYIGMYEIQPQRKRSKKAKRGKKKRSDL